MTVDLTSLPKKVKIVEVGPRDGLQNEQTVIPLDVKLTLIEELAQAGIKMIESGSFVSPKWVPQMADSGELLTRLNRHKDVTYSALTPNLKGLKDAINAGVKEVAIFGAASQSFSQKNINCSIEESLQRFEQVMTVAKEHHLKVRGYVSCVLGCPYEGDIAPEQVAKVSKQLFDMGCYEISLGDTIGKGTPLKTQIMLDEVKKLIPAENLAVHFHDTYGQAIANILVGLTNGISVIDSAVAGLGGCPYAKGASGNVATEDVIYLLDGLGVETGIDIHRLAQAGHKITQFLNKPSTSKVANALINLNSD